jgi:hypothetical protein
MIFEYVEHLLWTTANSDLADFCKGIHNYAIIVGQFCMKDEFFLSDLL